MVIDLGPGSLSKLFALVNPEKLDGLFISHLHPDHFIDIYPLRYYLQFTAKEDSLPLKVYAPPMAKDKIIPLFSDKNLATFDKVFKFFDLSDGKSYQAGNFRIYAYEVPHLKPTFAFRIEAESRSLFYSSDTAFTDRLLNYAQEVDLLLCESTLREEDADSSVAHLTSVQAGEIATKSKAKKLVLTHIWPHFNEQDLLSQASKYYSGPIFLAEDGKTFKL